MKFRVNFAFVFIVALLGNAQSSSKPSIEDALEKYGFTENHVISENDTVTYYLKSYRKKPENLVVFVQGTDPFPIFFNKKIEGKATPIKMFNDDYKLLDSTYIYAIVSKPGLSGIFQRNGFNPPWQYQAKNYREYRVAQIDRSIDDIVKNHMGRPKKVVVYGHSEGAQIASYLPLRNKYITHLGFWSGNVLNNFYEFALFERIAALKGHQTDSIAHENILGLLEWYKNVVANPESTEKDNWGYTNKRWSSYEEAPINNLLKIDIPIYAFFATKDESTPIETAYLLPVQFMQNRKGNLTFDVCIDCDHIYREKTQGGFVPHWEEIFKKFIDWTEDTK
jgi:pimeloyl-ACP methyl ester carboxylesterase